MIDFHFVNDNNITLERKQEAKANFLRLLGDFKDEFDENNGDVTIDFSITDKDDTRFYNYTFPNHDVTDFIRRWRLKYEPEEGQSNS